MSDALDHIAGWEAAGLIDRPTADRLRAAGDLAAGHDKPATSTIAATETLDTAGPPRSAVSAMFGPSVTISEVFAYLGGGFLLAAWSSFMGRTSGTGESAVALGVMALIAAGVLCAMGLRLMRGGERGVPCRRCHVPAGRHLCGGGRRRLRGCGRARVAAHRGGRVSRRTHDCRRAARRPSLGADASRRPRLAHRARGDRRLPGSRSRSSPRNSRPTPGFRSRPVPIR